VLSAAALAAAALTIPNSRVTEHRRLDYGGAVIATVGLAALLLAVSEGASWGWGAVRTIVGCAVAIVALCAWVRYELGQPWPLANLRLLRHRSVTSANLAGITL